VIVNKLLHEILPHRLIIKIVYNVMFWLNCFPHKDRIHATLNPHTIVTGSNINYDKHCKLQFGTYVQVHEQHDSSMATRTSGAIALHPTGNMQGSYYFLSLRSGKHIVCNNWTMLPMPAEVIATVHQLANACKKYKGIVFMDRHSNIINDTLKSDRNDKNNEITGVHENDTTAHVGDITGVYNNDIITAEIITESYNDEITGVHDKITEVHDDTTHANKNEHDVMHEMGKINNSNTADDDNISIEMQDHDDNHVTIDDLNIIEHMNAAQLNTDPEAGNDSSENKWRNLTRHGYNLRP